MSAALRTRGLRVGLPAVIAATTTLVAAPLASADKVTVRIEAQTAGQGKYTGKVKARNSRCVKKRTIQVYDLSGASPVFLGSTTTDAGGNYELVEFLPPNGTQVQIVVPKARKGKLRCGELERKATAPLPPQP